MRRIIQGWSSIIDNQVMSQRRKTLKMARLKIKGGKVRVLMKMLTSIKVQRIKKLGKAKRIFKSKLLKRDLRSSRKRRR